MGAFLPVWIIGAPLVFAAIDMFMTPKPQQSPALSGFGDRQAIRSSNP